jgi:hypothetical protein
MTAAGTIGATTTGGTAANAASNATDTGTTNAAPENGADAEAGESASGERVQIALPAPARVGLERRRRFNVFCHERRPNVVTDFEIRLADCGTEPRK